MVVEVSAVELATGSEHVYRSQPLDPAMRFERLTATHDYVHGVELPPGWFLVSPSSNAAPIVELEPPIAINVSDGAAVRLTALGG